MGRLMSVSLTEQAVRERRKTVTRRLGWWRGDRGLLLPGDDLTLCRKVMGLKPGEKVERICTVTVASVTREVLRDGITDEDVRREGFGPETCPEWWSEENGWTPSLWFVQFFTESMRCDTDTEVTRIEWRYQDA